MDSEVRVATLTPQLSSSWMWLGRSPNTSSWIRDAIYAPHIPPLTQSSTPTIISMAIVSIQVEVS